VGSCGPWLPAPRQMRAFSVQRGLHEYASPARHRAGTPMIVRTLTT
jgi:hypothetical protein